MYKQDKLLLSEMIEIATQRLINLFGLKFKSNDQSPNLNMHRDKIKQRLKFLPE